MNVWIDAQLAPLVAKWLRRTFAVEATAVCDVGFLDAVDYIQSARRLVS